AVVLVRGPARRPVECSPPVGAASTVGVQRGLNNVRRPAGTVLRPGLRVATLPVRHVKGRTGAARVARPGIERVPTVTGPLVDRMSHRPLARPGAHGVPRPRGRGARVLAHSLPDPPAPRPRLPRCFPLPRRATPAAARRAWPAPDSPLSRSRRRAG